MKPTTAVIFAAGSGTRMLPVTAAVQKELLPIMNRPVIDYIVTDLVAAGITRIIFVIRPGQTGLKDYYLGNPDYAAVLQRLGKQAALELLDSIHNQAQFEFVEQPDDAGYGTAIPLRAALPLLPADEPVLVCGGDDFVWRTDGSSETADFVAAYASSGAAGAIMALELPAAADPSQYGVMATTTAGATELLQDIVEKPAAGQAPSRLVNISKYILSGEQRQLAAAASPRPENGESYITDGILNAVSAGHGLAVYRVTGQFIDTGSPANWLKANQIIGGAV